MPASFAAPPVAAPEAPAPWLRRRLHDPLATVSLAGLVEHWVQADITAHTTCPAALVDTGDPALPDRLRGMLGRSLMEGASAEAVSGRPCPWQPPCALDLLFGQHGTLLNGRLPVPKPFALSVAPAEPKDRKAPLIVRLSLFGFATDWADTVAEAMVRGLRGGVSLTAGRRRPVETTARAIQFAEPPVLPMLPLADGDDLLVRLDFETPFSLRREGAEAMTARSLLMGLCNRLSGLARWHDARLDEDWPTLAALADRCHVLTADLQPVHWGRSSGRQKQGGIPISGQIGSLVLRGPLGPFLPALCLGQACGTGGHVALGLGRYRVVAVGDGRVQAGQDQQEGTGQGQHDRGAGQG